MSPLIFDDNRDILFDVNHPKLILISSYRALFELYLFIHILCREWHSQRKSSIPFFHVALFCLQARNQQCSSFALPSSDFVFSLTCMCFMYIILSFSFLHSRIELTIMDDGFTIASLVCVAIPTVCTPCGSYCSTFGGFTMISNVKKT